MFAKIATGETVGMPKKFFNRVRSGEAGAKVCAENPNKEERRNVVKKAAAARWG